MKSQLQHARCAVIFHGTFPLVVALADRSLVNTNKAKLLQCLEKDMLPLDTSATGATWVIDRMALLYSTKNIPATFKEIASTVVKASMITNARRIDFVTDRYPSISIKNTVGNRRATKGLLLVKITGGNLRRPQQWKKVLARGKTSLP